MKKVLLAVLAAALVSTSAEADITYTQGSGTTIKTGTLSGGVLPWSELVDATGTPFGTNGNPFTANIANGSGIYADGFAFTSGATNMSPVGCVFWTSIPTVTNGQTGACAMTSSRSILIDASTTSQIHTDMTSPVPAGSNLIGGTTPAAGTTFGASSAVVISATTAGGKVVSIKTSAAGTLYSMSWTTTAAAGLSIRFYDVANLSACNSSTGLLTQTWAPQAFSTSNPSAPGGAVSFGPTGVAFTNGLGVCITGADASNDATAGVTGLDLTVVYK